MRVETPAQKWALQAWAKIAASNGFYASNSDNTAVEQFVVKLSEFYDETTHALRTQLAETERELKARAEAAEQRNRVLTEALKVESVTREIERRFNLLDRVSAVTTMVHALDHIRNTHPDMMTRVNCTELIHDGIANALDGRSTGREHRTIRHSYRNERDGPHPPSPQEEDRRCQECGAVRPEPFTHCGNHRPLPIAALDSGAAPVKPQE